jgi:hypothetical protein
VSDGKTNRPLVASATAPDVADATTLAADDSSTPLGITRDTLFSETHFTQVPNHWLRNPDLSYRTKGILAAIASHRAGYRLTMAQLISDSKDGRDSVRAGVKEAELAGYLVLTALRDAGGRHQGYAIRLVEDPAGEGPQRPTRPGRDQGKREEPAGQNRSGFTAAATPQRAAAPIEEHSKKTMFVEDHSKGGEEEPPSSNPAPNPKGSTGVNEVVAEPVTARQAYPRHCPAHASTPNPASCGPCADARKTWTAWTGHRDRQSRTARPDVHCPNTAHPMPYPAGSECPGCRTDRRAARDTPAPRPAERHTIDAAALRGLMNTHRAAPLTQPVRRARRAFIDDRPAVTA